MNDTTTLANQMEWAAKSIAFNLGFIPSDKLDWKPEPTVSSAREIVVHCLGNLALVSSRFEGSDSPQSTDAKAQATVDELQQTLIAATGQCANFIRAAAPEKFGEIVELPTMTVPLSLLVTFDTVDLIHHHGQIAYIQALLGDSETHFDMSAMQHLS